MYVNNVQQAHATHLKITLVVINFTKNTKLIIDFTFIVNLTNERILVYFFNKYILQNTCILTDLRCTAVNQLHHTQNTF